MRKYLFLLAAAVAVFACTPKVEEPSAEEFAPYIKAFTGGIVPLDASLRIELAEDAAAQPAEGLFSLKPAVKGTVQWDGPQSVTFIPEELKEGQVYRVDFALGKVLEGAPEKFSYGISVKGAPKAAVQEDEPDNGRAFRVVRVSPKENAIELLMSEAPANANLKGLVNLSGAARSYVQVQGNTVTVHYEGRSGDLELRMDGNLKSVSGETLGDDFVRTFVQEDEKPAVIFPFEGTILPDRKQFLLPFRAVNLSAVEVRIVKIYESNILMFLQENELNGGSALRRSGRLVYKADIPLDRTKDLHQWNTHAIDLSGLIKQEPGAIYRVSLNFRLDQSLYGGKEPLQALQTPGGKPSKADESVWDRTDPYYWDNYYDWDEYDWDDAEDPTKPSYYMDSDRFPAVQILGSDLGLMADWAGDDKLWVAATDLLSAKPVSGARIEAYDYQLQSVGQAKTDGNGLATLTVSRKPFALVAKAGGSSAYLKLSDANLRSLSRFDVGGEVLKEGLKAFIYGERGIWRPGDTLHVSAIVADRNKALPAGHPATLEVYTPAGSFYAKYTRKGVDGFYSFDIPTGADDPTGYWNAYLKVGGSSFHKVLHIETIKPNRLKITTAYPTLLEAGKSVSLPVEAAWLSGGVAGNMPVYAEMTLRQAPVNPFKGFESYEFFTPMGDAGSLEGTLFSGQLDAGGRYTAQLTLPGIKGAPGMLQAYIVTSVEEPGGDESFTTETLSYSPFTAYVGVRIPESKDYYLETDKDHRFSVAVVDPRGNRIKGHSVEYAIYKTGWNWWWDGSGTDLDAYVQGSSVKRIQNGTVLVGSQDGHFSFRVDYPDWGRYLVLARDTESGHISGAAFTIDWPAYRGRASREDPDALTQITLSTDKPSYQVGEKATLYLPAAPGGKALVSLTNASGVLTREWVSTGAQDTPWTFTVTPEMAPNIYAQVTLLRPYGDKDLPLRLYGVQRVKVENPASHLNPVIQMPDVLHPEEPFTVKVSEKDGKTMTYTLAIVDEGLLDLTAFKTPDPWSQMYKWEALGVKTWDLYDQVIGAFGGNLSPLAAIGGDEGAVQSARKDNRFNPVVLFLAPRTLKKGTDELKLQLPMYVGSVRVMLVAGHDGAYGRADKTVPVQNPLMVVTTLPRVMGTGEETSALVNVFAMEDGIKEATVTVKADALLNGGGTQTVHFNGPGDQVVTFPLKADAKAEGFAHVSITATGSGHRAAETIALEVRNPNPEITSVERFTLEKGASKAIKAGTLQLASFPAIDVRDLFLKMKNYPYTCSEQLAARGIAILHLLPLLGEEDAADAKALIPNLITQLYARQQPDGGFAYWSGGRSASWVSSMAGQFLSEAAKAGFDVHSGVITLWKNYQQKITQVYRLTGTDFFSHLDEAYRLYTLALAGAPNLSGMNRLKESAELEAQARWMLACAYAVSGKSSLAENLLDGNAKEFPEYDPYNITYGSSLRDRLIAVDALALNSRIADALALAGELPTRSYTTQESAFAAMALHHLYEKTGNAAIHCAVNGKEYATAGSILSVPVSASASVENRSDGRLYGTLLSVSREAVRKAATNGIAVQVRYTGEGGAAVNPASLKQGTRFTAQIKVTGNAIRSHENLALDFGVPSGWEIVNERVTGGVSADEGYDYKDIRDDRVLWYFALPAGRSKTFTVQLRAAYAGSYVLPATVAEAMYDPAVNACTATGSAVVTR